MEYKKLIKSLDCDGSGIRQDVDGCSNRRCKYRDADGACNLVRMCSDASTAITDLLARAEAAEARAQTAERALARMWYAYENKDAECPHEYEIAAVREAEKILGKWENVMQKIVEEEWWAS